MLVLSKTWLLKGLAPIVTAKTFVVIFVRTFTGVPLMIRVLQGPIFVPLNFTRQGLGRGPFNPMLKVAITPLCPKQFGQARLSPPTKSRRLELAMISARKLEVPIPPSILVVFRTVPLLPHRPNKTVPLLQTDPPLLLAVLCRKAPRHNLPTASLFAWFLHRQNSLGAETNRRRAVALH